MTILWHGGSTVELKQGKDRLLLNPTSEMDSNQLRVVAFDRTNEEQDSSQIPLATPEQDTGDEERILVVDWPGEYDKNGFSFRALEYFGAGEGSIVYVFHTSEGSITWLGELKEYPSEEFLKELGEVQVLLLPVGGTGVLKAKDAFRLVEALEPMVVIPMCYDRKGEGLSAFLKEMDVKLPAAQKSFELKKSTLNPEQLELVILESSVS